MSQQQPEQLIEQVITIVGSVGFKDELGGQPCALSKEAAVVQDADRLEVIGCLVMESPPACRFFTWRCGHDVLSTGPGTPTWPGRLRA